AAEFAVHGRLNASAAREMINKILDLSSGERLHDPSIKERFTGWLGDKKRSRTKKTLARHEGVAKSFLEFLPAAKQTASLRALAETDNRQFRDRLLMGGRSEVTASVAVK